MENFTFLIIFVVYHFKVAPSRCQIKFFRNPVRKNTKTILVGVLKQK